MLFLVLLASMALPVWAWRRLHKQLVSGTITKLAAVLEYAAWALTPLLLLIGLFLGAMGTEELTGQAIIPELAARAALPVAAMLLGFAVVGWVAFLFMGGALRRVPGPKA